MIEQDTIKLLRECDAGIKMGVSSINEVLDNVRSSQFRDRLISCRDEHEKLGGELRGMLERYCDEGKNPNPIAKSMSWVKTNLKLGFDESDKTVADLLTDGCNMGVKSLHRYLNQYSAADESSKSVAKRLAESEERLAIDMRAFL